MTRMKAVSLFLVAVLVLAIAFAAFIAKEYPSGLVLQINQESSITLKVGATVPSTDNTFACGGCSGGGGTGG